MSEEQSNKPSENLTQIAIREPSNVTYWMLRFGVTRSELADAVEIVGDSVEEVATYFKKSL